MKNIFDRQKWLIYSFIYAQICHVISIIFSELLKSFCHYCLYKMSNQQFLGTVRSYVWPNNCRNRVLHYSMTIKQYCCGEFSLIWQRKFQGTTFSNKICNAVRYDYEFVKIFKKDMYLGFHFGCLPKPWILRRSKHTKKPHGNLKSIKEW